MASVLVAEDNEDIRDSFTRIIPRMNHTVNAVDDGSEAWELLTKGNLPDLIVSDYEMPNMTGLELLRKVRADARTANIRFVLMSGRDDAYSGRPLADICKEAGATFISKSDLSIREHIGPILQSIAA